MAQTLSMSVGRVAVLHDIREILSDNVDPTLSHNNMKLVDKLEPYGYDIEAYTNARFQPAIDAYNAKQTRADRRKTKPYVDLVKDENAKLIAKAKQYKEQGIDKTVRKPTELVREYVVQIGDHESNGTLTGDMSKNQEFARQFLEEFQEKYPHVEVLLAEFHGDEPNGTPHLHMLTQFVGEGYSQGLEQQISTSKALECDGIARSSKRTDGFSLERWLNQVKDETMEPLMRDIFHEERLELNDSREHMPTHVFRRKAKEEAKELEAQRKENEAKQNELLQTHDKLVDFRQGLVRASQSLDKGINKLETDKNALKQQKGEFEAYKALESQRLDEMKQQARQTLQEAHEQKDNAVELMNKAQDAWNVVKQAQTLSQGHTRESRMAMFMQRYKMGNKDLYQLYKEAEPSMIQQEKQNQKLMRELDRQYSVICSSFSNKTDDYEF